MAATGACPPRGRRRPSPLPRNVSKTRRRRRSPDNNQRQRKSADAPEAPLDPLAPCRQAARGRAHRRAVAGRLRGRPPRRDDAAGPSSDLRGSDTLLRPDLPDLLAARAGPRRHAAPRGPEHQGGAAARADLRRRQDPHPGGAAASRARPRVAAGPARGRAVQVRRRRAVAAGAGRGARLRQAGRREGDGSARAGPRAALAEASVERARLPDRGGGRPPGAARRGPGRGAGDGSGRALARRPAVAAAGRGAGYPGPDRRGADVRARQGRGGRGVARAADRLLPVPVPGGDQGRPLRTGGVAARLGHRQERRHRQGHQRADRGDLQPAEGGRGAAGPEGGCGRGAASALLHPRVDSRCGRLPASRDDRGAQPRRGGRCRAQGPPERRGSLRPRLSLPPRPDRPVLRALDAARPVPADARHPADVRHRAARRRELGHVAPGRPQRVPVGARPRRHRRSGP